jgi:hypothetical protein
MGLMWRLLAPRPLKRARRAMHPSWVIEDAIVHSVRGRKRRASKRTPPRTGRPAMATQPLPQAPSPQQPRSKLKRNWAIALAAGAVAILIIALVAPHSSPPAKPASTVVPDTASSSASATPSRTPTPTPTPTHHRHRHRHHHAVVPTPPPQPPPTTQAPAPAGCYPTTSSGHCYEPGEFCPEADAGIHGVAGDGEAIVCENNNGLRWEPA